MKTLAFRSFTAFALSVLASVALAQPGTEVWRSEADGLRLIVVASDLEHPWAVAFLPGGDYLVSERGGRLWRIGADGARSGIDGLPPITATGQGGLLDLALDPDFQNNQRVYFSYVSGSGRLATAVASARLEATTLTDVQTLFRAEPKLRGGRHFGSRLVFLADGTLLITLGDRGQRKLAQDPSNTVGSTVRINADGSIPNDNPFAGREGYAAALYTLGNRNVQGAARRPGSDQVWMHEHGPRGGDEVNIVEAGANYGWPEVTWGVNYSGFSITDQRTAPGIKSPIIYWDPSIAPSGMAFYQGDAFPEWRGDLFVGALARTHLRRLELEGDQVISQQVLLKDFDRRIRDVSSGFDGALYLLTDHDDGRLLRLERLPPTD